MEENLIRFEEETKYERNGNFQEYLKEKLQLKEMEADSYSPLVLAYMGDCVYELFIRTKVVNNGNIQVNKMHQKSASYVCAGAQAKLMHLIMEELTEKELQIYKRGRNAKSVTMAKNATVTDYRIATGFEALIGYLYLSAQNERMIDLICLGLEKMGLLKKE